MSMLFIANVSVNMLYCMHGIDTKQYSLYLTFGCFQSKDNSISTNTEVTIAKSVFECSAQNSVIAK